MKAVVVVVVLLSSLAAVPAFVPLQQRPQPTTLSAKPLQQLAGSVWITSTILSNVMAFVPTEPANALFLDNTTPSVLVSARSGGRTGGRATAPSRSYSAPSRSSSYSAPSRSSSYSSAPTTVIERRTTIVQQQMPSSTVLMAPPPVIMAPPAMYAPVAPPSGLGLVLGLNAVSGIADGFREARQENEIRSTREQLTEARIKEAEMEARLRALESQK
jgi:hypothetical protein